MVAKAGYSKTAMQWVQDWFVPLTIDDYLDGCDRNLFPYENHGDASFTGIWASSRIYLLWLEENWESLALEGSSILELGSGTGYLGIHLAWNLHRLFPKCSYKITLSDTPATGAYAWTKANMEKAKRNVVGKTEEEESDDSESSSDPDDLFRWENEINDSLHNIDATPFDWSSVDDRQRVSSEMDNWDLIVGTDLIYSEEGCLNLIRAMSSLVKSTGKSRRILYGNTSGRIPKLDALFEAELDREGLEWKILQTIPLHGWRNERATRIYDITGPTKHP